MNKLALLGGVLCVLFTSAAAQMSVAYEQMQRQLTVVERHMVRHEYDEATVADDLDNLLNGLESVEVLYAQYAAQHGIAPRLEVVLPKTHKSLCDLVARCAHRLHMPAPHVLLAHDSRFITAAAGGIEPDTAVLLLGTGLIEQLTPAQLTAVVLHELAHIAQSHVPNRLLFFILLTLLLSLLLCAGIVWWACRRTYLIWQWQSIGSFAVLSGLFFSFLLISPLAQRVVNMYEHSCEYAADAVAAAHTDQLTALSGALHKLSTLEKTQSAEQESEYEHLCVQLEQRFGSWSQIHDYLHAVITEQCAEQRARVSLQQASHPTFTQRIARLKNS